MNDEAPVYAAVDRNLQQGDVFQLNMVTPLCDYRERLFRTKDGKHGGLVFSENVEGTVFCRRDLEDLLRSLPEDPDRTPPFKETTYGEKELVVVYSNLSKFFVVATQSCDLARDEGRESKPFVIVLPLVTLKDFCQSEEMPLDGRDTPGRTTFHDYLLARTSSEELMSADEMSYGNNLRKVISEWNPTSQDDKEKRNRIKDFIENRLFKSGHLYFLKADDSFKIPEGYIDFSVAHTIPTRMLENLGGYRVARIATPYREEFSSRFADRFSRIAVPKPLKPDVVPKPLKPGEI